MHGLGCDAFWPENENENVERVHVVAGFYFTLVSCDNIFINIT
mgnify:CR=1 FL=1|jgi:hypothetical protein